MKDDYEALAGGAEGIIHGRRWRRKPFSLLTIFPLLIACGTFIYFSSSLIKQHCLYSTDNSNTWTGIRAQKEQLPFTYEASHSASSSHHVNTTLGFQKIIALSSPHRMDRRDEIALLGTATGLDIDIFQSKDPETFKDVGLPYHGHVINSTEIGCYRGHMDVWRKVLSENLSSALIIEDDADWDVHVKYAVRQLWQPFATLLESAHNDGKGRTPTSADPWLSQDWDVIFLGACYEWMFTEKDHPKNVDWKHPPIIAYQDDTVADQNVTESLFKEYMQVNGVHLANENDPLSFQRQRLIAQANGPICLGGYAVSKQGAAKLLYHSTRHMDAAIDVKVANICRTRQAECYITIPPLIAQWKIKDALRKNSDIRGSSLSNEKHLNHDPSIGHSPNIRHSARKALQKTLQDL